MCNKIFCNGKNLKIKKNHVDEWVEFICGVINILIYVLFCILIITAISIISYGLINVLISSFNLILKLHLF